MTLQAWMSPGRSPSLQGKHTSQCHDNSFSLTRPFSYGTHVACREAGLNLELSDVAVQSLVPEPLQNVESAADFMQQLPQYDADLARQVSDAEAAGECLRFVGKTYSPPSPFSPRPSSPTPTPLLVSTCSPWPPPLGKHEILLFCLLPK